MSFSLYWDAITVYSSHQATCLTISFVNANARCAVEGRPEGRQFGYATPVKGGTSVTIHFLRPIGVRGQLRPLLDTSPHSIGEESLACSRSLDLHQVILSAHFTAVPTPLTWWLRRSSSAGVRLALLYDNVQQRVVISKETCPFSLESLTVHVVAHGIVDLGGSHDVLNDLRKLSLTTVEDGGNLHGLDTIRSLRRLEVLHLDVKSPSALGLLSACSSELRTLFLGRCDIAQGLAQALQCRQVSDLSLFRCGLPAVLDLADHCPQLVALTLDGCHGITTLVVRQLHRLRCLSLRVCNSVREVDVDTCCVLTNFQADFCISLRNVKGVFEQQPELETVHISWCSELVARIDVESLPSLNSLSLSGCSPYVVVKSPQHSTRLESTLSLQTPLHLNVLEIHAHPTIDSLDLTAAAVITDLRLHSCSRLTQVHLSDKASLRHLTLVNCGKLHNINHKGAFRTLQGLVIEGSHTTLRAVLGTSAISPAKELTFTAVVFRSSLRLLQIESCSWVETIHLDALRVLEECTLEHFDSCTRIMGLKKADELSVLQLDDWGQLGEVDLEGCQRLTAFHGKRCPRLHTVRGLSDCGALSSLSLYRCPALISAPPLLFSCSEETAHHGRNPSLSLSSECDGAASFFGHMCELKSLVVADAPRITVIDLSCLTNVADVTVNACFGVETVRLGTGLSGPLSISFSELPNLRALDFSPCAMLTFVRLDNLTRCTVEGLRGQAHLREVVLTSCHNLCEVDLRNCPLLHSVWVEDNRALEVIRGVSDTALLTSLTIARNPQLKMVDRPVEHSLVSEGAREPFFQ